MKVIENKDFHIIYDYHWSSLKYTRDICDVEIYISSGCYYDIFIKKFKELDKLSKALNKKFKYNSYVDYAHVQRKNCISYSAHCKENEIINVGDFIVRYIELDNFS